MVKIDFKFIILKKVLLFWIEISSKVISLHMYLILQASNTITYFSPLFAILCIV